MRIILIQEKNDNGKIKRQNLSIKIMGYMNGSLHQKTTYMYVQILIHIQSNFFPFLFYPRNYYGDVIYFSWILISLHIFIIPY